MKKVFRNKYMMLSTVLLLTMIITWSYAFWGWTSPTTTDVSVVVGKLVKIVYIKGQDINDALLKPTAMKEEGIKKDISVFLDREPSMPVTINFHLDIVTFPEEMKDVSFKWELYRNNEIVNSNNFSNVSQGSTLNLSSNNYVTTTKDTYSLYIWIDGNMDNPSTMSNKSFSFKLWADGYNATPEEYNDVAPESCFAFDTGTKTITRYYANEGDNASNPLCPLDVIIPEQISGVNVEVIADGTYNNNVFYQRNITSVILPSTLKKVGDYAFYQNKLTNATIQRGLISIGTNAFRDNQLTSLSIPNGVTTVSDFAFSFNQLTSITIPSSVTTIGNYAFRDNLITNVTIPNSITTIASGLFLNNKLMSVTIPDSVTTIESSAFSYNQLINVTIPNSITKIESSTFNNNQLTSVTIPTSVTEISHYAFQNNLLESITIPTSVIFIGQKAFTNNKLPDEQAFIYQRNSDGSEDPTYLVSYGGAKRDNVIVPGNVTTIGSEAFRDIQLTSVILSNNLTTIGSSAFYGNKLSNITIPSGVVSMGSGAFKENQLTNVIIQSGVTVIGHSSFSNNFLEGITIPNTVVRIDADAFKDNRLISITIPNSVTTIGNYAFENNQLTSITISSTVTSIGWRAFNNNKLPDAQAFIYARNANGTEDKTKIVGYGGAKKDNVIVPNGVTKIDSFAFANCQITSITLPNGLIDISSRAFENNLLTTVTIPSTVTSISIPFYKSATSNPNLTKIINKTGKSFDWGNIVYSTYGSAYNFVTGTVENALGNVQITSS